MRKNDSISTKDYKLKKNGGITLIALVITIIVLLILAGITIVQLSNSGLFEKTQESKEKWDNAEEDENTKISKYENEIDNYVSGNRETITIPVEEYNRLKNHINYSTEEQCIGTWIDGLPLYEKVILLNGNYSGWDAQVYDLTSLNTHQIVKFDAWEKTENGDIRTK